jgi:hypothetical protein
VPKWIDLIGIALADAVVDRAETRLMMTSEHGADVSGRARARKPTARLDRVATCLDRKGQNHSG